MAQLFLNNARCVLAESVSAADDLLQVKNAVNIPSSLDDGDYILLTLFRDTSRYGDNIEVVKVTYISRGENPGELKLSVERGYEFDPQIHTAGERVEARLTAKSCDEIIRQAKELASSGLVYCSVTAEPSVKERSAWQIGISAGSYLSGVSATEAVVTWQDGSTQTVTLTSGSASVQQTAQAYPSADLSVSVVAVDELGNQSRPVTASASVLENQPPVGTITINHASTVGKGGAFDVSLSGATDPDGDTAAITYEIVDSGILAFAKTTGIAAGELVSVAAPDVATEVVATFTVRAVDDMGATTVTYSSSVTIQVAQIIGVKLVTTGGNGGTWAHIDDAGAEIAAPSTSWFNAHPVWGGIVDQIIDGQYMVKVPKFYYKRGAAADGKAAWWISDQPIAGFSVFPAFVLDGAEVDQFWYGKYQASESGGKLQSTPGVLPKVSTSLTDFLTMATARNTGGVTGFRLHHYDMWLAIQWLYLVENATMDSQTRTGQGRVTASSAANVDASDVAQAAYRGMVGLWGNVYQWMDGVRTLNDVIERRAYNGSWISTGEPVPNSGNATYPLTFRPSAPQQFISDTFETGNTNATLPDYTRWRSGGEYYPCVGGVWSYAANAGLWCVDCGYSASSALSGVGARLARIV